MTEAISLKAELDQRFVFASLALELVVAYWFLPVSLLIDTGDLLAQAKLFAFIAQISLGLTVASLVLMVVGLLRRGGRMPTHRRALVGLSLLAIPGVLFWAWWTFDALFALSSDCQPLAAWKCYFVEAGTYLGYSFFPAIAIPIVTLVWVSRIRTRDEISPRAAKTGVSDTRVTESSYLGRTDSVKAIRSNAPTDEWKLLRKGLP